MRNGRLVGTCVRAAAVPAFVVGCGPAIAQESPSTTPGPADRAGAGQDADRTPEGVSAPVARRPRIQLQRWLEDWRPLAEPALRIDPLDRLKYLPLAPDGSAHLTLSGQLREEVAGQTGGLFSAGGDVWGLHRLYLGADLHLGQARVFAELGNAVAIDRRGGPGPTDEDRLDLQLLFADWRLNLGGVALVARVGRQELAFDATQRFVGVREGPNLRQAFDAIRVNAGFGKVHVSAFAGRPVAYRVGVFDDPVNRAIAFKGVYAARTDGAFTTSLYVYGYRRDGARFGAVAGRERRTAYGMRIADRIGPLDFDVEAMLQRGSVGPAPVRAWAVASLAGWTFAALPWKPRLGVQLDFASGDRDRADGRIGTFNPLFYKGNYFTEAPIATMANVRHLKVSLSGRPSARHTFSISAADVSRMRLGDLAYLPPLIPQPTSAAVRGRRLGGYFQGIVSHAFGTHLSLSLEAARFLADRDVAAVGGRDLAFAKLTANFLF